MYSPPRRHGGAETSVRPPCLRASVVKPAPGISDRARAKLIALAFLLIALPLAAEGRVGTLTLSDGTAYTGEVSLTKGKKIDLFIIDQKKRYSIDLAEVVEITTEVERESLEHPWHFIEESRHEKGYLPETYPLRKYLLHVKLASGPELVGHVTAAPIYVRASDEKLRYFLLTDQKGDVGQALTDLVYVKSVTFEGAQAGDGRLCRLGVDAQGAIEVRVVDAARDRGFEARGKAPCVVTGLLPGGYDLFVRYPDRLRCAMTASGELTEAEKKELDARVQQIEEFFDDKRIRVFSGSRDRAKVLLEMRRVKDTTDTDASGRSYHQVRWEVWTLHKLETTWQVDARVFLFRERLDPGAPFPEIDVVIDPKLGDVRLDADRTVTVE